jgi:hypothetical protein
MMRECERQEERVPTSRISKSGELRRTTSFWRYSGHILGSRTVTRPCPAAFRIVRGVVKGMEDGFFGVCNGFWSSAEDKTGVVLEEITSDCADAILLIAVRV